LFVFMAFQRIIVMRKEKSALPENKRPNFTKNVAKL
jgi:hypothetical protein